MTFMHLDLQADTAPDLVRQLAALDISVPYEMLKGESETGYREKYSMAHFLATLAQHGQCDFPVRTVHSKQSHNKKRPDFACTFSGRTIGIECTTATPHEWEEIKNHRDGLQRQLAKTAGVTEAEFSGDPIPMFPPMFKPGIKTLSKEEMTRVATGEAQGYPWVGTMHIRQWAEAVAHFIKKKTKLLRDGHYSEHKENWLLIQDEWPTPAWRLDERIEASRLCLKHIAPLLEPPSFSHIFIGDGSWLMRLFPGPVQSWAIPDLWKR